MGNYFVEARRQTKLALLEMIRNNPNLKLDQILGMFSLKTGLRIELLKTYVEELKQAKVLE